MNVTTTEATDDMPMAEAIEDARSIGEARGKLAAGWAFDGNTPRQAYEEAIEGLDAGDPATYDRLGGNEPDLHHDFTARDLCDEIGVDYDLTSTREVDQIADAYLAAAIEAYWAEVERTARCQLAG